MKRLSIFVPILFALFFVGCGGSNGIPKKKIVVDPEIKKSIEEVKKLLNDNTPNSTEADFNKSNINKVSKKEQERSIRAHNLVATAKDPDPQWFATKVDNPVIVAKSGEDYTVHLFKQKQDGSVIGPVDNDKLRLVVRIQRDKETIDTVTNIDIDRYAKWSGDGVLDIHVPNDLSKGRLLIGVRPNFTDVATEAIAERWSTLISAEVWQIKPNVKIIDPSNVVFPIKNKSGFRTDSKFSKQEVGDLVGTELKQNDMLLLPLVVKDITLDKDDLVSYTFDDKPYAGKVYKKVVKGTQQLVLLTPEYSKVYEMTELDENTTIDNGLYPEHVVYRDGDRLQSDTNESDPTKFSRSSKTTRSKKSNKNFEWDCTNGNAVVTFETKFSVYPVNAGIELSLYGISDKVECTFQTKKIPIIFKPMIATGGLAGILMKIFGTEGKLSYYGGGVITVEGLPGVGAKMGWTYNKGKQLNLITPKGYYGLGSLNLDDLPQTGKFEIGANVGALFKLSGVSPDGWLGSIFDLIGQKDKLGDLGIEAKIEPKLSLALEAYNAAEVYRGNNSGLATIASYTASVEPTKSIMNFLNYADSEGTRLLSLKLSGSAKLKGDMDFTFKDITDDGQGHASVNGLKPTSKSLSSILPQSKGVIALTDKSSSVFNDLSESISYNLEECNKHIIANVIACSGWMCGKVDQKQKKVKLCKGDLSISPIVATARVDTLASAEAKVSNNTNKDIVADISGSPLAPNNSVISLSKKANSSVKFSKECKSAGVFRGKVTASSSTYSDEAEATLVCYDDDMRGDPHMVTADKLGYDFFASGDYIISRIKDIDGYEVQARFLPGFKTSWPQAVGLKVGDDTVEIQGIATDGHGDGSGVQVVALAIWINGQKYYESGIAGYKSQHNIRSKIINLPSGGKIAITNTISSHVLTFPTSIAVIWPKGSQTENYGVVLSVSQKTSEPFVAIQIARPKKFAGREEGLMGNNNGNPDDDFIRRNGQQLGKDTPMSFTALYALFGADWLVRHNESLFRNPEAIKPKFPDSVTTLTPQQRALGESACRELTGYYREACIMDVGLTGSADLVKEYYANSKDLNELSKKIKKPNKEDTRYTMTTSQKELLSDSGYLLHYRHDINITKDAGEGNFMLMLRPPRGSTASLANGELTLSGSSDISTSLEIDCTQLNSATDNDYLQSEGALQLWIQDPFSGALDHKVSEVALSCVDESQKAVYTLQFGKRDEFADSNDTNQHYTRDVRVKHTSGEKSEYIVELTPPKGATLKFANGSEDNITTVGEFNSSIELDCVNINDTNSSNKGIIKLWEIDPLFKRAGRVLAKKTLSCKKNRVLKTGQTKSYTKYDDGYYQKGEDRSYTRDDVNEIVTDNATGLMWQDNAEAKTVIKNWYDAKEYCQNLTLGGYDDWKLPSRKELSSLVTYNTYKEIKKIPNAFFCINPIFKNLASKYIYFWSSTSRSYNSIYATDVHLGECGTISFTYKSNDEAVRCVREID